MPTLIIHGDDDQVVPINVTGNQTAKLIKNATLKVYAGAPHGLMSTHRDRFHSDLLEFARGVSGATRAATSGRRGGSEAPAARVAQGS